MTNNRVLRSYSNPGPHRVMDKVYVCLPQHNLVEASFKQYISYHNVQINVKGRRSVQCCFTIIYVVVKFVTIQFKVHAQISVHITQSKQKNYISSLVALFWPIEFD